ncbi:MAG TPA: phosphatase PAP2 family protein [Actinomycetota bacterium]
MARKEHEHPLLQNTVKDFVLVACLGGLAIAIAILVAIPSSLRGVQRADDAFLRLVLRHRTGSLTAVAKVLNVLGASVVTLPVRILAAGYLAIRRRWWHVAAFVSAIALSEIVTRIMKSAYDRQRPPGSLVHTTASSFPSGHAVATSVTVVALVIAFVPTGRQRAIWGTVATVFSFLMAISRAYLAAHWLSDAIEGTLIGVTCAMLPAILIEEIRERRHRRAVGPTPRAEAEPAPPSPG